MQQLDQSIHSKEVIFNGYLNNRLRTYILLDRLILFFIIIPILIGCFSSLFKELRQPPASSTKLTNESSLQLMFNFILH